MHSVNCITTPKSVLYNYREGDTEKEKSMKADATTKLYKKAGISEEEKNMGTIYVSDKETGTFIEKVESIEAGIAKIKEFEEADKQEGTFELDFYDIVDENHCSLI